MIQSHSPFLTLTSTNNACFVFFVTSYFSVIDCFIILRVLWHVCVQAVGTATHRCTRKSLFSTFISEHQDLHPQLELISRTVQLLYIMFQLRTQLAFLSIHLKQDRRLAALIRSHCTIYMTQHELLGAHVS